MSIRRTNAKFEKHLQIGKGWLAHRGDCAKNERVAAAPCLEMSASLTSIQAANTTIAYGMAADSDVFPADGVKAYEQPHLKSENATGVDLLPVFQPEW